MRKKTEKIIEPIDASFDEVVKKVTKAAPHKPIKNNALAPKSNTKAAPLQGSLDLGIEIEKDVGGIEMGVLENGIPFLTQSGVAKICGTTRSVIYDITQEWAAHKDDQVLTKGRLSFLKDYLSKRGYYEPHLYIETVTDKTVHYSYPDVVCMAILEYYAFEAKQGDATIALENYRTFAAAGLRKFIYDALGYTPGDKWKFHNARLSILQDTVPLGYFSIFHEITALVVDLINADLTVNNKTVPDISVGICWATYWKENNLASDFGERIEYKHNYPPGYPQALSNPQPASAYPDEALATFRRWFRREYLTTKFPSYILKKANILPGGKQEAEKLANLYQPKQLSSPK